jgi:hypothetical protein
MAETKTHVASEYQPARDFEEGEPVGKILVFCKWGRVRAKGEPNFLQGFIEIPINPLIWGGICAASYPILLEARYRQLAWLFILAGYCLSAFHGETLEDRIGLEWIGRISFVLFMTGCCIAIFYANRITRRMRIAMADLNPTLAKLGYRVSYEVESTGNCYSEEHRIYIYALQAQPLSSSEILQRFPPSEAARPAEPVAVYLYVSTLHRIFWRLTCSRPDCFIDGQPPALTSLNSFLWGALHYAVRLDEIEGLQRKYASVTLICLFVLPLLVMSSVSATTLPVIISIVIFYIGYIIFLECYLSNYARNIGHATWTQAVDQWRDTFAQAGWQLEYHHHGDDVPRTCSSTWLPNYSIRFVPSRPV